MDRLGMKDIRHPILSISLIPNVEDLHYFIPKVVIFD